MRQKRNIPSFSGIYDYVVHKPEQSQMSSHLIKCFQKKKMEPFPYKKVASIRDCTFFPICDIRTFLYMSHAGDLRLYGSLLIRGDGGTEYFGGPNKWQVARNELDVCGGLQWSCWGPSWRRISRQRTLHWMGTCWLHGANISVFGISRLAVYRLPLKTNTEPGSEIQYTPCPLGSSNTSSYPFLYFVDAVILLDKSWFQVIYSCSFIIFSTQN